MKNPAGIGMNIMISEKYFKQFLRDTLEPYGLNAVEGLVLHMMKMKNSENTETRLYGNTQEEIVKEIHYDKGVIARTMKSLEDKELVVRNLHPSDSRCFLFVMTDKGEEIHETVMNVLSDWNSALLDNLSSEETEAVSSLMEKVSQNALKFYRSKTGKI